MKYFTLVGVVLVLFSIFGIGSSETYMSLEEARKKWGNIEFSAGKFKAGDSKIRATMSASLISGKNLLGNTLSEIYTKLGPSTGYYFSDVIPAFAIGDLSHGRKETWQLIFIPDNASKYVVEVKIHKKCCEN